MVRALLVQPAFDEPTSIQARIFNSILKNLIRLGQERGIETEVLYGWKANEEEFKLTLAKFNPDFIYFGGHGIETRIMGQNMDALIQLGYNEYLLKGRMIYAFECKTAQIIGKFSGARAFLGYEGNFYIYDNEQYLPIILDLGFRPLLLLYSGYSFGEAYNYTKRLYRYYLGKKIPPEVWEVLFANYRAFRLYGDENARLIKD